MTDDEAAKLLEERACRTGQPSVDDPCKCAPGECQWVRNNYDGGILEDWKATAATLGLPLPALAALARGDAVVVPRVLTEGMAANSVRAIVPGTSTPLWVKFADARLTAECMFPAWTAALNASPFKGGA